MNKQNIVAFFIAASVVVISEPGYSQQATPPSSAAINQALSQGSSPQALETANAIRAALQQETMQSGTATTPQQPAAAQSIPGIPATGGLPPLGAAGQAAATNTIPAITPSSPAGPTVVAPDNNSNSLPTPDEVQAARDQAFDQMTLHALPMTPDQIQKLRDLFATSQRAATAYPGGTPPKPVASTEIVKLSPGATLPIVRLGQGLVSSVVFLDSTGAPWPIQSYDIGNPGAFNIQWDRTSNVLLVQSSALYTQGNLAVMLKGLNTPVMINLIPGQPIVDYRLDMRVQGLGPNATPGSGGSQLPAAADNQLINVLDGIPPPKSKALTIPTSNSQAWLVGDTIYLRTQLTLLSPASIASMSSADGTKVYQIPKTPSILVSNDSGKFFNLGIEGY